MAIPTYKEDPKMYRGTGLYEVCVFCKKTTTYWHKGTNNPVCGSCAKKHKVSELHNWLKKKETNQ